MRNFSLQRKGFTLIELLMIIAIIGFIVTIAYANMQDAKKHARDEQRMSDLKIVKVASRSYQDFISDGILPPANPAEVLGDGVGFDTTIAPYVTDIIKDPINAGTNQYYYRSAYTCAGTPHTVVVALSMEIASNGNFAAVCGAGPYADVASGVTPTLASYVIILQ
ncbi:type II secretion system protein [Candidatus Kaiserbacteria bacterium]|nr:MAG: type II secretion system protein [Candidatus Kaiserbacteria bacterium]